MNPNSIMPLDPIELDHGDSPQNTPPFIDENPERDLVQQGLDASEDELRDAADDEFGVDPDAPLLDDIGDEDADLAPEVVAIHEDRVPIDDDNL